jgi:hypothetical protein
VSSSSDQAEVTELRHAAVVDEHVRRLEVPVHEPERVDRREAVPDGNEDVEHRAPVVRLAHPVEQRHALDELHRDERILTRHPDLEHGDDVRVRQPRERLRFAKQPRRRDVPTRARGMDQLERDAPAEQRVTPIEDERHPAGAESPDHLEMPQPGRQIAFLHLDRRNGNDLALVHTSRPRAWWTIKSRAASAPQPYYPGRTVARCGLRTRSVRPRRRRGSHGHPRPGPLARVRA